MAAPYQLSPEDHAAWMAALQAEADAWLAWRRTVEAKQKLDEQLREKYINQKESQPSG